MVQHIPILLEAVVQSLRADDSAVKRLVDGTVGGGGHSRALLRAGIGEVLACDLDPRAIAVARQTLAEFGDRVHLYCGSYVDIRRLADRLGWCHVDAILLDLGLSSLQLEDPRRGFSFRFDAPLDMRFDTTSDKRCAQDLVNQMPAGKLADLLFRYGEERGARRIARAIVAARPIRSTSQLADVVAQAKTAPGRRSMRRKIHPATQVFQALRIAVNEELAALERVIPTAVDLLRPGGRLAVISFHSLEDRIVKRRFKELATTVAPPPGMASIEERQAQIRLLNRKPIVPQAAEIDANPRSRSAKLRAVEKLGRA